MNRACWSRRVVLLTCSGVLFVGAGCGEGMLSGGSQGAYEPDDAEGRQTFASGMAAGTEVEVCKTGGSGLNLRSGPGKNYGVLTVLPEDQQTFTVLVAAGDWYKIDAAGDVGWSYGYYLCPTSGGSGTGSGGGGSTGGAGECRGSFENPAPGRVVTQNFGGSHKGIDLGMPIGTSIGAADGGVVEFAGWMTGYGYAVDVNHCGAYTTRYAHLSQFVAEQGQAVSAGETIARSGNTGNSTGPHLHFEIRLGGRWGTAVNPRGYVSF